MDELIPFGDFFGDLDKALANFEDGVLEIKLTKTEKRHKGKKVEIK